MGQNNCKICGNCETQFLIEVESKRYAPGEHFKLYRCRKCEGVYINPYLTFDEIQKILSSRLRTARPETPATR